MALTAFLKFNGNPPIEGESRHPMHVGWIDLYEFDGDSLISPRSGVSRRQGTTVSVNSSEMLITKKVDRASPRVYDAFTRAVLYTSAVIEYGRDGKAMSAFSLEKVMVTSFEQRQEPG